MVIRRCNMATSFLVMRIWWWWCSLKDDEREQWGFSWCCSRIRTARIQFVGLMKRCWGILSNRIDGMDWLCYIYWLVEWSAHLPASAQCSYSNFVLWKLLFRQAYSGCYGSLPENQGRTKISPRVRNRPGPTCTFIPDTAHQVEMEFKVGLEAYGDGCHQNMCNDPRKGSRRLISHGKAYYLKLAGDVVRSVREQKDKDGIFSTKKLGSAPVWLRTWTGSGKNVSSIRSFSPSSKNAARTSTGSR